MINICNCSTEKCRATVAGFKPPFALDTFINFYIRCGFSRQSVAELFDKSETTIKRWENKGAPLYALLLIYSSAGYILDAKFSGHRIINGHYYPNMKRTEIKPTQLEGWNWMHSLHMQQRADYQHRITELEKELDHLREIKKEEEEKTLYKNVIHFKDRK